MHRVPMLMLLAGLAFGVVAEPPRAAAAKGAKIQVANNGSDSPTCGGKNEPCRSLGQALANARDGDRILVGPGLYGDLNGDDDFDDPGEEAAQSGPGTCNCLVEIDKAVSLTSSDGAAVTIVHGRGLVEGVVDIVSDGVTFGGRGAGFTVMGGTLRGVGLETGVVAEVEGNLAFDNPGDGFFVEGDGSSVQRNVAMLNGAEGFAISVADEIHVEQNLALANGAHGFLVSGCSDPDLAGNVASGNAARGFWLVGNTGLLAEGNLAAGNDQQGFVVSGGPPEMASNAALANGSEGFWLEVRPTTLSQSNIAGNDEPTNCGLRNSSGLTIEAERTWWGAATGPGANPADAVCQLPVSATPLATKENKVKVKQPF